MTDRVLDIIPYKSSTNAFGHDIKGHGDVGEFRRPAFARIPSGTSTMMELGDCC